MPAIRNGGGAREDRGGQVHDPQALNRRAGRTWRFLQFPLTRIVLSAVALIGVQLLLGAGLRGLGIRPHSGAGLAAAALVVVAVLATYGACVRLLEQRAVVELGRPRASALLAGFAIGVLLFAFVMALLMSMGVASVTGDAGGAALPYALAAALLAAVGEETLFRGVLFRIIERSLGSGIALAFTAALFGALHAFNRGATVTSSLAIALEAGVLLAAAYMYSRRLWMPIGLHAGWNFTEGGLFGASVSGGQAHGVLASHFAGPMGLTGGAFGPEASGVAVLVCLALGVTFIVLAARRGHLVAPYWDAPRPGA